MPFNYRLYALIWSSEWNWYATTTATRISDVDNDGDGDNSSNNNSAKWIDAESECVYVCVSATVCTTLVSRTRREKKNDYLNEIQLIYAVYSCSCALSRIRMLENGSEMRYKRKTADHNACGDVCWTRSELIKCKLINSIRFCSKLRRARDACRSTTTHFSTK